MPRLLLRVARRRTAWAEPIHLDALIKTEFRAEDGATDLSISVYDVTPPEAVQAFAEHAAGADMDPPRGGLGIDLAIAPTVTASAGTTGFPFTTAAHREVQFADEDALRAFLSTDIIPTLPSRSVEIAKDAFKTFLQAQRQDPVWAAFFETHPKWRKLAS